MLSCRHLLLAGLVACSGPARAEEPKKDDPKKEEKSDPNGTPRKPATGRPMLLAECLTTAEQHQPRLKAAYSSLRGAEAGVQGLNGLGRIADRLSPDLPVRRLQAALGLRVAQAEVDKTRQETVYDVTFLYFSFVYASQSEKTATDVLESLDAYYKFAEDLVNSGVKQPGLTIDKPALYNLQAIISKVQMLRLEAETKRRQTLVALREAMGVGPECDFQPAAKQLPVMGEDGGGGLTEELVVQWALARRPELVQTATAVAVFSLEPAAQALVRVRPQVNTLAAGTDLHSKLVPLPLRNGQYRPGGLDTEMPISLVGKPDDRVARACEYAARQGFQHETTVGLVRAEASAAFIDWDSATVRMGLAKKRSETSRRALEEATAAASTRLNPQQLVAAQTIAGEALADYVKAVYEHLVFLAKLQRVTAGGVQLNFAGK